MALDGTVSAKIISVNVPKGTLTNQTVGQNSQESGNGPQTNG